jgi:hypothetical protein
LTAFIPTCPPSVREARRFFVPVATCRMVRLTYFGSTLGDLCRPCAIISRSVGDVLARINDHNIPKLDQLLPWNWKND